MDAAAGKPAVAGTAHIAEPLAQREMMFVLFPAELVSLGCSSG